jgi:hypothetical protein
MSVALATTYHDAKDRMYDQIAEVLPIITHNFAGIAVIASSAAPAGSLQLLSTAGALIQRDEPDQLSGIAGLGQSRRAAVALALQHDAPCILYFDFDSMLHWAQHYPKELAETIELLPKYDMTIVGRTRRALASHPQSQRDTEILVNQAFARLTGYDWDVMRSGRGLSRRAAEAIIAECTESSICTDVVWPLFLLQKGSFSFKGMRTEGTEFETGDRYAPEVIAAGGYEQWLQRLDADPRRWMHRLELACRQVAAMIPFAGADTHLVPGSSHG